MSKPNQSSILEERFEQILYTVGAENEEQIEHAHEMASIFCNALATIMKEDPTIELLPLIAEYVVNRVKEKHNE